MRGLGLLLLAVAACVERLGGRCIELVVAGSGPLRDDLALLARKSGIHVRDGPPPAWPAPRCRQGAPAQVWFAGAVVHDDAALADDSAAGATLTVPAMLRACDLLANPVRQETFGLVVAEALAQRLPVVSCQSAASAELREAAERVGWHALWRGVTLARTEGFARVDCSRGPADLAGALVAASKAVARTAAHTGDNGRQQLVPFPFGGLAVARRYATLYARVWSESEAMATAPPGVAVLGDAGPGCVPCMRSSTSGTRVCACMHLLTTT